MPHEETLSSTGPTKKEIVDREYLHSISRIGDRLKMLKRDISKMKDELSYMQEDVQLLSDAFDSMFTDLINKLDKKDNNYSVENI